MREYSFLESRDKLLCAPVVVARAVFVTLKSIVQGRIQVSMYYLVEYLGRKFNPILQMN